MLRVGITGGIGSGKSTVAAIFEQLGVKVYYADQRAKALYVEDLTLRQEVVKLFGQEAYQENQPNKDFIAKQIFHDNSLLKRLNNLVHPRVFQDYENWCNINDSEVYTLKEAAIIFESGSFTRLHRVIGVIAPEDLRIKRVMNRDHVSKEQVLERMSRQMDQNELAKKCHDVILNDEANPLIPTVISLHHSLIDYANKHPLAPFLQA